MRASSCSTPATPPTRGAVDPHAHALRRRRARGRRLWQLTRRGRGARARSEIRARGAGQCRRPLGRRGAGRRRCAATPPAKVRLVQGSPHRRAQALRPRPLLHLPERRRPHRLRHPLRARLHPDRHDRPRLSRATRPSVAASAEEIAYLCARRQRLFRAGRSTPADVVWTYSGVRPLYDDGATEAQAATRDYVLTLDARRRRRRCCSASSAARSPPTAGSPRRRSRSSRRICPQRAGQPAGPVDGAAARRRLSRRRLRGAGRRDLRAQHPCLAPASPRRLVRAYGTRARGPARRRAQHGRSRPRFRRRPHRARGRLPDGQRVGRDGRRTSSGAAPSSACA